jgi:phosphoribosylanthranilate isomerase
LQAIFSQFKPDVLQTDVEDLPGIELPAGVQLWPVLRDVVPEGLALPGGRFLFEGPRSGTGRVADWNAARALAKGHELILAGGPYAHSWRSEHGRTASGHWERSRNER